MKKSTYINGYLNATALRWALDIRLLFIGLILLAAAIGYSLKEESDTEEPVTVETAQMSMFTSFELDGPTIEITAPPANPVTEIRTETTSISIIPVGLRSAPPNVKRFIGRWIVTAVQEQKEYGIPASANLAQGAKESGWGSCSLATQFNSYFGVKCQNSAHRKHGNAGSHCARFHDNTPNDRFIRYGTAWESWRAHSRFLMGDRYKKCLESKTAGAYCDCIAQAGYAYPNPAKYAAGLKWIINNYDLAHFDSISEAQAKRIKQMLLYGH